MLGSLDVHNDLSIIRYEPYHGFYKDNKRLTMKKKYPKVIIKNGLLAIEEEQSTEIKVIMDKEKSIVELLIELDELLKLETKEDVQMYYLSTDPEDKILRTKYAWRIYGARRLLGLSLEAIPGALLPSEPVDEFSELVNKSKSSGNHDH